LKFFTTPLLTLFLTLFLTFSLITCGPLKRPTPTLQQTAEPSLTQVRELDNEADRFTYDNFNFETSFTDFPEDTRAFDATCYVLSSEEVIVGTGTLIENDVILTAAHVAIRTAGGYIQFNKEGILIPIEDVWVHPNWILAGDMGADIALLKLSCEADNATPLVLGTPNTRLFCYHSSIFTVGCSLQYKKQSLPQTMIYYGKLVSRLTELKLRSNSTTIWFGDSGGPVVLDRGADAPLVVGVVARFSIFQQQIMDATAIDVRHFSGLLHTIIANWEVTYE